MKLYAKLNGRRLNEITRVTPLQMEIEKAAMKTKSGFIKAGIPYCYTEHSDGRIVFCPGVAYDVIIEEEE